MKVQHGGPRNGSGRPDLGPLKKVPIGVRIRPEFHEIIKKSGLPISAVVNSALAVYLPTFMKELNDDE